MKKVLIAFAALICFSVSGMAQAVKKADAKVKTLPTVQPTTPAKVVEIPKTTSKTPAVEKQKPVAATPVVLKKDGTPDKRFKSTTKAPVKKDGTPDMRYNKNKKG